MQNIKYMSETINHQSVIDKAIELTGSADAYALAVENGLSVTDSLVIGVDLKAVDVVDEQVRAGLESINAIPGTAPFNIAEGSRLFSDELPEEFM